MKAEKRYFSKALVSFQGKVLIYQTKGEVGMVLLEMIRKLLYKCNSLDRSV